MIKIYFSKLNNPQKHSNGFKKKVLSKVLNIGESDLSIKEDLFGKPYIDNFPHIHFNISHSKRFIACGVSDSIIGIDIEDIKPLKEKIVEKFYTLPEKEYIYSSPNRQNKRFIEIWTKKEAYAKGLGLGLVMPFDFFNVLEDERIRTIYIEDWILSVFSQDDELHTNLELFRLENFKQENF